MTTNWTKQYMVDKAYRKEMELRSHKVRLADECKRSHQNEPIQQDHTTDSNGKQGSSAPPLRQLRPKWALITGIILAVVLLMLSTPVVSVAQNTSDGLDAGTSGDMDLAYAIFYLQIGEYELAIDVLDDVLTNDPDNASAYAVRGTAHYFLTEYEYAIADSEAAIAIAPDYSMPYWTLGDVYFDLEDYDQALDNYLTYIELAGNNPDPYVLGQVALCR